VTRLPSTAFCVALLAATAAAFALTQGPKTEPVPIYAAHADAVFSPDCNCGTSVARIDFRLRTHDRLTVWMERDGKRVRTLVPGRTYAPGFVALQFDGVDDRGLTLPEGSYRPVVRLAHEHRTIELPSATVLDTTPVDVHVRHRVYTHISPDGDGRNDVFRIPYSVSRPAHGILIVDRRRVAFTPLRLHGTLAWNGRIGGRLVRPGNHVLEISAQDRAGNRTAPFPFAVVTVRYVSVGRSRVLVRPRGRFAILVLADAPRVEWRLHGGHGTAPPGTLRLRAPARAGVYRLYVSEGAHAARVLVVVG